MQLAEPITEYRDEAHATQLEEPALLYLPSSQDVHSEALVEGVYLPATHLEQAVAPVLP